MHLGRALGRVLRSGKEFSPFGSFQPPPPSTESLQAAISTDFDVSAALQERLSAPEQDEPTPSVVEDSASAKGRVPPWIEPPSPPMDDVRAGQSASHQRRRRRRHEAQDNTEPFIVKNVARRHPMKAEPIEVNLDAGNLYHTSNSWTGPPPQARARPPPAHPTAERPSTERGMQGVELTEAEVRKLVGKPGFRYIRWDGRLAIPILDVHRRVFVLLAGTPADVAGWTLLAVHLATLFVWATTVFCVSTPAMLHRRARRAFAAISRGISFGGGQQTPSDLCNNNRNTRVTDHMLRDAQLARLVGFTTVMFFIWAPNLFMFYWTQRALLKAWNPDLIWPFDNVEKTIFSAYTFNFGSAVCREHYDFGNLAWGWCAITALGKFNPDRGGHLILWELKLIIRFPPGATILLPSAIIRHSNTPIQDDEERHSFTQYTAGGLFRWIRNGFRTDAEFDEHATEEEKAARDVESATRWQTGVGMFSTLDELHM